MQNPIFLVLEDWMETHNFPEGDKVRCFHLTLIGEAQVMVWITSTIRWWLACLYKINSGDNTQNRHTPKQLFHAWRTFKFNENTDTVDSFCSKNESGSSNAKLWRNADIREFQDTLLHQLYSTIINVNNLRDAINLAKEYWPRKSWTDNWLDNHPLHSWEQPVMTIIHPKTIIKKGVTFDAMEMLERNSDCID